MQTLRYQHVFDDWRTFNDANKASFKAVVPHCSNAKSSVPLAFTVQMKKRYETVKLPLEATNMPSILNP